MNIGIDGSRAFVDNPTGTENYSLNIIKHICQLDQNNNYYIYLRSGQTLVAKSSLPNKKNYRLITIPYPRLWTQLGLGLQTFKDKIEVLFIPAHTLPIIRRPDLTTVITVHDLGAEYLPKMHQLKQRLYLNFMSHWQLCSASAIIAVSNSTKKDLIEKAGIQPDKISVIYEGYDQYTFKPMPKTLTSKILSKYNLEYQNYFLFVGTIQPRKNLERLIRAYHFYINSANPKKKHKLKSLPKLVLAGSKGWLSEPVFKLSNQLEITSLVKFLGYVPKADLPTLYSSSLGLLFPSLFEGFGLPILEAFASGCPVLTSSLASFKEVAGQAAIFVDPNSTKAIAQGIDQITDQNTAANLRLKGFKQVKKFSWEKAAGETLDVLNR